MTPEQRLQKGIELSEFSKQLFIQGSRIWHPHLSQLEFHTLLLSHLGHLLLDSFPPPEYHVDKSSIESAIRSNGMFDLLHTPEGNKVDFWMGEDRNVHQLSFPETGS